MLAAVAAWAGAATSAFAADSVYVNGTWAGLTEGTQVPVEGETATIGVDACFSAEAIFGFSILTVRADYGVRQPTGGWQSNWPGSLSVSEGVSLTENGVLNFDLAGTDIRNLGDVSSYALVGANGRTLWASWLLGIDPANADVRDISLSIDVSSGVPRISWDPALPDRVYTLYGCDSLSSAASWYAVPANELDATCARFFRLSIGQQQ